MTNLPREWQNFFAEAGIKQDTLSNPKQAAGIMKAVLTMQDEINEKPTLEISTPRTPRRPPLAEKIPQQQKTTDEKSEQKKDLERVESQKTLVARDSKGNLKPVTVC